MKLFVVVVSVLLLAVCGQLTQTQKNSLTDKHNTLRQTVVPAAQTMPNLVWDDALATIADNWVKQCKSAGGLLVDHNPGRSDTYPGYVGENMFEN
jgi:uncharacterized protein YkwD